MTLSTESLSTESPLDLDEIQGFVFLQYLLTTVRHLLFEVTEPSGARRALGRLVSGDEAAAPQVSTASDGHSPSPYRLHVGITWAGLVALEVPNLVDDLSFRSFPAFTAGAADRAESVSDTGPSGPEHWTGGFGGGRDHVLVTLYATDPETLDTHSDRLTAIFEAGNAFTEVSRTDGAALTEMLDGEEVPVPKVHFGYVDGISQPTVPGAPEPEIPDHQRPCEPSLFVLRDDAKNYYVPEPAELGRNATFGVFKMIRQDVVGFEAFLADNRDTIDPELLAAKVCGRWRNGVPLALSPDTDTPPGGISHDQLNDFEYVHEDYSGDPAGIRTPVGAHIRRANPRGQPVRGQGRPGGSNNSHRLIRRGMPYGPNFDPDGPDDGIERGLLVYFINTSIENQYEFVAREWMNDAAYAGATRLDPKSKSVLTGRNDPAEAIFEIPQSDGCPTMKITGFSSFVTTRAAAYCFLPSITGLRFIAGLG